MKVCIGGTFDKLHKGHKTLIKKAFEIAEEKGSVFIGITTDDFFNDKKNVKPLTDRIKNVKKYLSEEGYKNKYTIQPISDKFGPTVQSDFNAIVVSSETIKTAKE
ncbi:MAG: hypothetical protein A3K77_04710, partial [Euryarchaeota archaeon RBG_13_31_8]